MLRLRTAALFPLVSAVSLIAKPSITRLQESDVVRTLGGILATGGTLDVVKLGWPTLRAGFPSTVRSEARTLRTSFENVTEICLRSEAALPRAGSSFATTRASSASADELAPQATSRQSATRPTRRRRIAVLVIARSPLCPCGREFSGFVPAWRPRWA